MNTFRHDPEGAANASATEQHKREVRALQAAQALPHVCTCGMVQDAGGGWTRPAELPPLPHSHGSCPECVERYRHELNKLRATAGATRRHKMRGGRGG